LSLSTTIDAGTITNGFASPFGFVDGLDELAASAVGSGMMNVVLCWGRDMDRNLLSDQRKRVARRAPETAVHDGRADPALDALRWRGAAQPFAHLAPEC
jgi:hypothetical protein